MFAGTRKDIGIQSGDGPLLIHAKRDSNTNISVKKGVATVSHSIHKVWMPLITTPSVLDT